MVSIRTIQPKDLEEAAQELQKKSKAKTVSKVTVAKKILNKKIQVNTHIKFDADSSSSSESEDDNEPPMLVDTSSIAPVPIDDYQSSKNGHKIGGIELDIAQKKLKARDKLDRKRERERIKALHQEKRRKGRLSENRTVERIATLGESPEDDDSLSESEIPPLAKRGKREEGVVKGEGQLGTEGNQSGLSDDEELALHLLNH